MMTRPDKGKRWRRHAWLTVFSIFLGLFAGAAQAASVAKQESTADHSRFEELKGPFEDGPAVTRACLKCHTEAAKQLHDTTHWTWEYTNERTGQQLGKVHVLNNFCISVTSNWPRCTSCHIGYGWEEAAFDHSREDLVDCLVCHDTTNTYTKFPTDAGHPLYEPREDHGHTVMPPDLAEIAQKVGEPSRDNCGDCHFYGGGGDGVKHGDLDSSLYQPSKAVDVHMAKDGLNFACHDCHTSGGHEVTGSRYATKASDPLGIDVPGHTDNTRASCESCHGAAPHPEEKLNDHVDRVACPTCHIPEFARGGRKTKTVWDWASAGRMDDNGKPITEKDAEGYITYISKKGVFEWEENVRPDYKWYNGEIRYALPGETIDPEQVVAINDVAGGPEDPSARIWPFKVMHSTLPYDKQHRVIAPPQVFGNNDTSYWKNFDWPKALEVGMQERGMEFSGDYGFVDTIFHWPIVHMVAPKEEALACEDCHAKQGGRLADLTGFYMPGRDGFKWLDTFGWAVALLCLIAVLGHGALRILTNRRQKG